MPAEIARPSYGSAARDVARREAPADLGEIYERWFDFVWRSARRLGVDAAGADDVVQEVFVVVHRQLAGFEGRSSIKTWLFGILRHVVRHHRRRDGRAQKHETLEDKPLVAPDSPQRDAEVHEAFELLNELLDELDDDKREVFVLAHLEEMSAPEIAEALEIKLNTVYSRLRLAQEAMERAMTRRKARERWRCP